MSYYKILNIDPSSSMDQIIKSYKDISSKINDAYCHFKTDIQWYGADFYEVVRAGLTRGIINTWPFGTFHSRIFLT